MVRQTLPLIAQPSQLQQAMQWQQQLLAQGMSISLHRSNEPFTARWLRQHPALCLLQDEQGLWLAAQGMRMQPGWAGQLPRLQQASSRNELLARACQVRPGLQIVDATAGLGHDGLLLAFLGAGVTLIEQHPVVATLLQSAWQQAQQASDDELAATAARMTLVQANSAQWLAMHRGHDVVYLDPMFPASKNSRKQAQVRKEMQLLQLLFAAPIWADSSPQLPEAGWLELAQCAGRRVIVKRPRHALPLAGRAPDHQWLGEAVRFDGYFAAQRLQDNMPEASVPTASAL